MLYLSGFSREKREIHYKDLAHTIMETGVPRSATSKVEIQESPWCKFLSKSRLETPKEPMFQFKSKGWKRSMAQLKWAGSRSFLFLSLFVLIRSFTDWMRLSYIKEGDLLYSVI